MHSSYLNQMETLLEAQTASHSAHRGRRGGEGGSRSLTLHAEAGDLFPLFETENPPHGAHLLVRAGKHSNIESNE